LGVGEAHGRSVGRGNQAKPSLPRAWPAGGGAVAARRPLLPAGCAPYAEAPALGRFPSRVDAVLDWEGVRERVAGAAA
jgi:hypothetical protein